MSIADIHAHTVQQLLGQLGLRVQVYADVGGHVHSVRKPANESADQTTHASCCYLGGPHTVCGPVLVGCKLVKVLSV